MKKYAMKASQRQTKFYAAVVQFASLKIFHLSSPPSLLERLVLLLGASALKKSLFGLGRNKPRDDFMPVLMDLISVVSRNIFVDFPEDKIAELIESARKKLEVISIPGNWVLVFNFMNDGRELDLISCYYLLVIVRKEYHLILCLWVLFFHLLGHYIHLSK